MSDQEKDQSLDNGTPDLEGTEETNIDLKGQEVAFSREGDATDVAVAAPPAGRNHAMKDIGPDMVFQLGELDDDDEYSTEEYEELTKLYEDTISEFSEGEIVTGKVLAVTDKEVAIDIGFKSEGTVPIDEFEDPASLQIGEDIEVFLDSVEDQEGQLVLSKKKADFMRVWEKISAAYDSEDVLHGRVVRRIKGGLVVDLYGVDAFLPGSQIDVRPIRDFDALVGREMDFKVVKINHLRKNIVVSHRILVESEMAETRQKVLENLEKGQVLEGSVKNITDFGVFIDLGGVDGLLHINDLSWGRVSHPSVVVSLDEKINVMVLDFNEPKDRISLGLKQLLPHPWEGVEDKYPEGAVVDGKVVSLSDYGAFVELERGIEGLVHISEMSWTQHIKHPSKLLSVGEIIQVKILRVDKEGRKISLGIKQLEPDPWESLEQRYPVGTQHRGVVRNLTQFGVFVELEEGIDGLVHISDLSWTKKVRHPGEMVKKGEEMDIVILRVDKEKRRISLGHKQLEENPWERLEGVYGPNTRITGKIVRLIEKGVIVELPEGVDGFVPMSHLAQENIQRPADAYNEGDELELLVIEFSQENKKIVLSEKRALGIESKRRRRAGGKKQGDPPDKGDNIVAVEKGNQPESAAEGVATEKAAEAPADEAEAAAPEAPPEAESSAEAEAPATESEHESKADAEEPVTPEDAAPAEPAVAEAPAAEPVSGAEAPAATDGVAPAEEAPPADESAEEKAEAEENSEEAEDKANS